MILNSWIVYLEMFVCGWSFQIVSSHAYCLKVHVSTVYLYLISLWTKSSYWDTKTKRWNKSHKKKSHESPSPLVNHSKPFSHSCRQPQTLLLLLCGYREVVMSMGQCWDQIIAVNAALWCQHWGENWSVWELWPVGEHNAANLSNKNFLFFLFQYNSAVRVKAYVTDARRSSQSAWTLTWLMFVAGVTL